jgi:hypothetical protein
MPDTPPSGGAGQDGRPPAAGGAIVVDGPPTPVRIAGGPVRLSFAGTAGQGVSLGLTDVRLEGPCCLSAAIVDPDGLTLAGSGGVGPDGDDIHAGPLPVTGAYSVVIDPSLGQRAGLTATLSADVTGALSATGPSLPVALRRPGQQARFTFDGQAGQHVSLGITDVAAGGGGCCAAVRLAGPDSTVLASDGAVGFKGAALHPNPLPETGPYTVSVDPSYARTVVITLTLSNDLADSISIGGPPKTIRIARPGQRARLTFDTASPRRIDLEIGGVTAGVAGCCAAVTVIGPDGSVNAHRQGLEAGDRPTAESVSLPAAGAYTLVVDPGGMRTLSMTLSLK